MSSIALERLAYTTDEAAAVLGCSKRSLYNYASRGIIRYTKLGGRTLWPRSELERVLTIS